MLNLFMPTSQYQVKQFKLYVNDFVYESENQIEELHRQLRISALNFHKIVGYEGQKYIDILAYKSKKLSEKAENFQEIEAKISREIKQYKVKEKHSVDVAYDSKRVGTHLDLFNEENIKILWSTGLLHDIGRFLQMRQTGTFKDAQSFNTGRFGNINDHGQLGESILLNDDWIKVFYPVHRMYDEFIGTVVGNHFESHLPDCKINHNHRIFKDYGLSEIVTDKQKGSKWASEEYEKLASWYVKIIQDVDRLDILKQIERGDFNPVLSSDEVDNVNPLVYDMFYNGKYININDLRQKGLWTCNAGQLVRWSFLYQLSLVSTVKNIKNLNLIEKVWKRNPIDNLKPGYDFTLELMDALIKTSPDGVYIDKEKALSKIKKTI